MKEKIDQLRAELTALRGGVAAAPPIRTRADIPAENSSGGPMITMPTTTSDAVTPTETAPADESPVTYAPVPTPAREEEPKIEAVPVSKPTRPSTTATKTLSKPTAPSGRTHTVTRGDTLFSIAQKYYGSRGKWREIYSANRDVMPNETALKPGMTLKIP
jgi:nucleoid-associated protein YgaU